MKRKIFQLLKRHSCSFILFCLGSSIGFAIGNAFAVSDFSEISMIFLKFLDGLFIALILGLAIFAVCYILLNIWFSK